MGTTFIKGCRNCESEGVFVQGARRGAQCATRRMCDAYRPRHNWGHQVTLALSASRIEGWGGSSGAKRTGENIFRKESYSVRQGIYHFAKLVEGGGEARSLPSPLLSSQSATQCSAEHLGLLLFPHLPSRQTSAEASLLDRWCPALIPTRPLRSAERMALLAPYLDNLRRGCSFL